MSTLARPEDYSPGEYGLPHAGEVISDHRKKAGWTSQETFAIVCGVDKQTVAYWENLRYLADMDRRIFLSKLLKIPPTLLGLTWLSVADKNSGEASLAGIAELLEKNAYALYEDILTFANTSSDKYSPTAAYRFYKHQQELEKIVPQIPEIEKDSWQDLLSRFYQHSTFIAQHHKKDKEASTIAQKAVSIATPLNDPELLGAALYRRSRIHLIQNRPEFAREDIGSAMEKAKKAGPVLKGSSYLLAAEVNALYAKGDEGLKTKCRNWQDNAAKIIYNGKIEEDSTFLTFNLHAVHHERAKTLLRFALFHIDDEDLVAQFKNTHTIADKGLLKEAQNALLVSRRHLDTGASTKEMYLSITEARIYLIAKEYEESAKIAKVALHFARQSHSQQGIEEVKKLYRMLHQLAPMNPYIAHLGIELDVFPLQ